MYYTNKEEMIQAWEGITKIFRFNRNHTPTIELVDGETRLEERSYKQKNWLIDICNLDFKAKVLLLNTKDVK